jgi:hypothetical protein
MSDSAFPMHQRFKPAPGVHQLRHGLHPSFAHLVVRIGCPALCRAEDSVVCRHWSRVLLHPRGPRSGPGYSVPGPLTLVGPIRPTRRHIAISRSLRLIRDAFAVRERLGSELSLHIPSGHAVLYVPGEIEIRFLQFTDFDIGLRQDPSSSALPVILPSVSSRARFRGSLVRISLRPVQLLASLDGSDRDFSQPPRLLRPGFPRVSFPSRGWISLRQSLECSVGGTFTHWNGSYPRCTGSARAGLLQAALTADV